MRLPRETKRYDALKQFGITGLQAQGRLREVLRLCQERMVGDAKVKAFTAWILEEARAFNASR